MKTRDLWEYIEEFEAYNRSRNLSPKSLAAYGSELKTFARFTSATDGPGLPSTARKIREFISYRIEQGKAPVTIKHQVATLRTFYSFLVMEGVMSEADNPMRLIKTPKAPKPDIRPLTTEQVRRFLATFNKKSATQYRDYIMGLLMLDTGLRLGEVVRLKVSDVDFEGSRLTVNGKGAKTRTAYMGRRMRELLLDYVENRLPAISRGNGVLFPPAKGCRYPTLPIIYASAIIRQKFDQAGIPRAHSSAHRLRHTFATNFLRGGGDVFSLQKILGHASLEMTRRYVTLADDYVAEVHRRASPLDHLDF